MINRSDSEFSIYWLCKLWLYTLSVFFGKINGYYKKIFRLF